jgi:hypothetical protein
MKNKIENSIKKNKRLFEDTVCNLQNYKFKIDFRDEIILVFTKQYSILEVVKGKVVMQVKK